MSLRYLKYVFCQVFDFNFVFVFVIALALPISLALALSLGLAPALRLLGEGPKENNKLLPSNMYDTASVFSGPKPKHRLAVCFWGPSGGNPNPDAPYRKASGK